MGKTILFGIAILLYLMGVPVTSGMISITLKTSAEKISSFPAFDLNHQPIVVAENEQEVSENGPQTTGKNETQAPETGAAIKEKSGTSNDGSKKPIKPFKPSEEIAAEQAVDFPVDI